jgi:hypothetical protein
LDFIHDSPGNDGRERFCEPAAAAAEQFYLGSSAASRMLFLIIPSISRYIRRSLEASIVFVTTFLLPRSSVEVAGKEGYPSLKQLCDKRMPSSAHEPMFFNYRAETVSSKVERPLEKGLQLKKSDSSPDEGRR